MGVYDELGVRRVINAWGPMTVIGGSRMVAEMLEAMPEAGSAYVDRNERQQRAGSRIAELICVEGGSISSAYARCCACRGGRDSRRSGTK